MQYFQEEAEMSEEDEEEEKYGGSQNPIGMQGSKAKSASPNLNAGMIGSASTQPQTQYLRGQASGSISSPLDRSADECVKRSSDSGGGVYEALK